MENTSQPPANSPASGGNTEDYQAALARLEKEREEALNEKRGMYAEMKAERERRQALEDRLAKLEQEKQYTNHSQQAPNVQFIAEFADRPHEVLQREFTRFVEPLKKDNEKLSRALLEREALDWLAEQEDTKVSKIRNSSVLKEIVEIAKERNLNGLDVMTGTQAAYEIYRSRKQAKAESEKARASAIQNQSTEAPVQPATLASGQTWRESDVAKMDNVTYARHQKDIDAAIREGRFVQDLTGNKK